MPFKTPTKFKHLPDEGATSRVDLTLGQDIFTLSETFEYGLVVVTNWFAAIREIMLSDFPNPISSARRPP